MKPTALLKKITTIQNTFEAQIDKLQNLADEFDDSELSEIIGKLCDKLSDIIEGEEYDYSFPSIAYFIEENLINNSDEENVF